MLIIIYVYSYTIIRQHFLLPHNKWSLIHLALIGFYCTYSGGTENSALFSDTLQMLSNILLCDTGRVCSLNLGLENFCGLARRESFVAPVEPHSLGAFRVAQTCGDLRH